MDLNKTENSELRILLVEDNEHDRIAFKRAFKDSGIACTITEYDRAEDALERLQSDESSFDVVITDHGLPGMSGLEFCKELLARKARLPLAILTGKGTEQIASEALKSGVYDYIIKDDYDGYLKLLSITVMEIVKKHEDKQFREKAEKEIKELNESLERRVIERTEELRKSEMKYSILAQTSPVGMWHSDANGNCLYINERCSEIIGLSVEDALQDGWAQNLHPDDRDRVFKEWYDTAKNKQVFESEYRFTLPNGKTTWVYGQAIPEIDKNKIVVGYVGTITDITERKKFEDQISSSLKEKEVLIKEVQHRVKNNMQLITSLLRLQSERIEDKHLHDIFLESQNRIKSMALIHEELYKAKDFTSIEFYNITRSLINSVMRSYEIDPNRVAVNMIGNEVLLDVNKAISCGLIINELVSNSLKYAFPEDKKGELKVSICRIEDPKSRMELIISDNGVGLPEDIDFKNAKTLGLDLVNTLTDQLDGAIELDRSKGTEFKITFEA